MKSVLSRTVVKFSLIVTALTIASSIQFEKDVIAESNKLAAMPVYDVKSNSAVNLTLMQELTRNQVIQIAQNYMLANGEKDFNKINKAALLVSNIVWRESKFSNITNPNDHNWARKRQVVHGYGQFLDASYALMFKKMKKTAKLDKTFANNCPTKWKQHDWALKCQVTLLTFAVKKSLDGDRSMIKHWSTYEKAKTDTNRQIASIAF